MRGVGTCVCIDYVGRASTCRGDRIYRDRGDRTFDCREDRACLDYANRLHGKEHAQRDHDTRIFGYEGDRVSCDPCVGQVYFDFLERVAGKAKIYIDSDCASRAFVPPDRLEANRARINDSDCITRARGEGCNTLRQDPQWRLWHPPRLPNFRLRARLG